MKKTREPSELQTWILAKAATQERVYYCEILQGFFGWQPMFPFILKNNGELALPGRQYFSRREIGNETYNQTMVRLSRACERLERSGLVIGLTGAKSRWSAVSITDLGRESVSANTAEAS